MSVCRACTSNLGSAAGARACAGPAFSLRVQMCMRPCVFAVRLVGRPVHSRECAHSHARARPVCVRVSTLMWQLNSSL
jgi:hypothetical protein